jgi:metallo-beta-lactamase family protein
MATEEGKPDVLYIMDSPMDMLTLFLKTESVQVCLYDCIAINKMFTMITDYKED